MGIGTGTALAIGAVGSIASSVVGGIAASHAANEQQQAAQGAINTQNTATGTIQQNAAPGVALGQAGANQLTQGLASGQFGPGGIPKTPAAFQAPTLAQAQAQPGYQFTQQQAIQGLQRSAAARGGLGSGATAQATETLAANLGSQNYGNVFNQALQTYGAGLQGYEAALQGQQQGYSQVYNAAGLGQQAIQGVNQLTQQGATNVGNLMTQQGNAAAAGTVGVANAVNQGIGGVSNLAMTGLQLNGLNRLLNPPGYSPAIGNGGAPVPSGYGADGTQQFIPLPG